MSEIYPTTQLASRDTQITVLHTKNGTPIRFSVCIPNYNYGKYIGETITSVLKQSYPHFEIVIADNASTDDSVEAVKAITDPRVRLLVNSYNIGFAPNLDRATETARYEYLILLSSDDLMLPGALETYANAISSLQTQSEHCVLTSAVDQIDSLGRLTGVSFRRGHNLYYQTLTEMQYVQEAPKNANATLHSGVEALAHLLREKESPAHFLATCYPRSLYQAVEGYHSCYRIFPDDHFLSKLLATDALLVYVPQRLFAYRQHANNQSAQELSSGALKYSLDAYMRTYELPQSVLDRVGVRREEIIRVFIRRGVMDLGLQAMAMGSWLRALKSLAFGFATYPSHSLRESHTYALAALLCFGPAGKWLARGLYSLRRKRHALASDE